jgi:hypothetical protein
MHGFVDNNGTFTTIDGPGATSTTLNGINDFGEVTGFYTDASGNTIGLVGTPVGGTNPCCPPPVSVKNVPATTMYGC